MYRSNMHRLLVDSISEAQWTRSTTDEDNFRQVLCSHLYQRISPNNVEIPSTRSSNGDIKIFGRKIELKYSSNEKQDHLNSIMDDFDLLLDGKIAFSIVSLRPTTEQKDDYLSRVVRLPAITKTGMASPFGIRASHNYFGPGILLPASKPINLTQITLRSKGSGRHAYAYMKFLPAHSLPASAFLKIGKLHLHVDIIGSREDGLITYVYKRADDVVMKRIRGSSGPVEIPYSPANLKIATADLVNCYACPLSHVGRPKTLERRVPRYKI